MSPYRNDALAGRVAFVVGGTSGLNLSIARRLAELGAKVAVAGRDAAKSASAAALIGPGALGLSCDVRSYEAARAAAEAVAAQLGPIDILISGAAGNFLAPAAGLSANGFRTVVDIDLNGTFNVFRSGYDLLRKPGASLIAISAPHAVKPIALQAHACAAKAGVQQLVRVLALEWGEAGVRVNCLSPGPVGGTEGVARLAPTAEIEKMLTANIPLGRYGLAHEVAEAAVFLCSDAASYVTGATIDCDGGAQFVDLGTQQAHRLMLKLGGAGGLPSAS